jgi:hypothetical protein
MPLRAAAIAIAAMVAGAAFAVPPGYRYVGSRVVSEGRVVYWYWNADRVETGSGGASFVAHMYARNADLNEERPYVAIVRCDARLYRGASEPGGFAPIDDGEPISAVWRAGCDKGLALPAALRMARLNGTAETAATPAPAIVAQAPSPPRPVAPAEPPDPRRADACLRFAEARPAPAGDATIANACGYAIEVTLCYKGSGPGPFDCPTPAKGRFGDSLGAGITHVLPEYRRGRHKGIAAVACRGEPGTVFPRLDDGGRSGCF